MSKHTTIRERIERAAAYLPHQEGVVLTTFNLNPEFLTGQALPTILGVEATTPAAIEAETHQRLGATPCTVFYEPGLALKFSGRFRFIARPIPIPGRFFHPKLVVIAGRDKDNITWVYLAVSSANLTLSGWGRNALHGLSISQNFSHRPRSTSVQVAIGSAPLASASRSIQLRLPTKRIASLREAQYKRPRMTRKHLLPPIQHRAKRALKPHKTPSTPFNPHTPRLSKASHREANPCLR